MPNNSRLKLREGEPENRGDLAKWAYPLQDYKPKWYHFNIKCNHVERFPFSSTLFVHKTDDEHHIQFKQTKAIWITTVLIALLTITSTYISNVLMYWTPIISLASVVVGMVYGQIKKEKNLNIN